MTTREQPPAWAVALVAIPGGAFVVLTFVWLVTAFRGGEMPIIGYVSDGGFGQGMLWLLIVEPIAFVVLGFAANLVMLLLAFVYALATGRRPSQER